MTRSVQDLLAERRANVLEMSRERDAMARKMLAAHVAYLDTQIANVLGETGAEVEAQS